ncbi:hypothetical protein PVK06_020913 [Gossypium arboreum]|uniref:Uncharacterized protein n=1 Tax=Gossypium arboreum TaxID=29729 RepID=A0ABR0PNL7_GOSAR|nr:hypothetical protein PVK06_020913 [Gossypium arboreum]
MGSEGKQDRGELSTSSERVSVQESEVSAISLTSGTDNLERGIEVLTWVAREVLEEVLEARIRETIETLQARCLDYGKKRFCSPSRLEPHSAKRVRMHVNGNSGFREGSGIGGIASFCDHCNKFHSGK